jgi:hypothetical protein
MRCERAMTDNSKSDASNSLGDRTIDKWPQRTDVHLDLPENLSLEEWREIGRKLNRASSALKWYVGDWLLHGERKWGSAYTDAINIVGLSYDTLARCKSISARFEFRRRRLNLRWSDHREVAALDEKNQEILLDASTDGKWSRERLRDEVRKLQEAAFQASLTDEQRAKRRAAFAAEFRAVTAAASRDMADLQRIVYNRSEKSPTPKTTQIALDTSGVSKPVPESLRNLTLEPPPLAIDRGAVASAAIDALSFEQAISVFSGWYTALTITQQSRVCEALSPI